MGGLKKVSMLQYFSEFITRLLTFDYFFIKRIIKKEANFDRINCVMDAGCGTGILAPLFKGKDYLGIDIDKKSIDYAKKKGRGNFLVGDITGIEYEEEFDFILVVGVFHHLNKTDFLKANEVLKKALKKGGRMLVIEPIPPIFKLNLLGLFLRKVDQGKFIRNFEGYRYSLQKQFNILRAYNAWAGFLDYAVFVCSKKLWTKGGFLDESKQGQKILERHGNQSGRF